jgi:hypothetical protein
MSEREVYHWWRFNNSVTWWHRILADVSKDPSAFFCGVKHSSLGILQHEDEGSRFHRNVTCQHCATDSLLLSQPVQNPQHTHFVEPACSLPCSQQLHHLPQSWARSIQSTPSHLFILISFLILLFYLRLRLSVDFLYAPPPTISAFLFFPYVLHAPPLSPPLFAQCSSSTPSHPLAPVPAATQGSRHNCCCQPAGQAHTFPPVLTSRLQAVRRPMIQASHYRGLGSMPGRSVPVWRVFSMALRQVHLPVLPFPLCQYPCTNDPCALDADRPDNRGRRRQRRALDTQAGLLLLQHVAFRLSVRKPKRRPGHRWQAKRWAACRDTATACSRLALWGSSHVAPAIRGAPWRDTCNPT